MSADKELRVTKAGDTFAVALPSEAKREDRVASSLQLEAVRRLRLVSLMLGVTDLLLWSVVTTLHDTLLGEFRFFAQWAPPVFVFLASVVVYAVTRSRVLSVPRILDVGLVYQVVVSYGIAFSSYWAAFEGVPADAITFDRVGLSFVALWMVLFVTMVPVQPRRALLALLASAMAVPIVFALNIRAGIAPRLPPFQFFVIFVLPYLLTALGGYVSVRILQRLGIEVRRAQEMGSYRLEAPLGEGGMGEVWRATHRMLARPAAIKLIRREALAKDPISLERAITRFEREARVTASLRSPHTVELYDYGISLDGTLYYVMELLDGIDLEALIKRHGPLPAERVVHILKQACGSLAEAHRRSLIHRDIKPANIYLCRQGIECDFVKILDFGLVKHQAGIDPVEEVDLTHAGAILGTPSYIAPEFLLDANTIDGRADLYSLGCVAFWLLTGQVVFEEKTATAIVLAHVNKSPDPPSRRTEVSVPPALDDIVLACLAKKPADRPPSAEAVAERLAQIELAQPWTDARAAEWWMSHGGA